MKLPLENSHIATYLGISVIALAILTTPSALVSAAESDSSSTINGSIGSSITISSAGSVNINVTPTSGPALSSASDTVTVNTNSTGGYTLSLEMNDATTSLANGSDTITAHTGTPTDLAVNTWGYRVDSMPLFGGGTTAQETNTATSSYTWAGVPANGSPVTIKATSDPAPLAGDSTSVWYAMKADTSRPSGAYTNTVLYTAVTN